MGGEFRVEPGTLRRYGKIIEALASTPGVALTGQLSIMGVLAERSFLGPAGGDVLPAGAMFAAVMAQNLSDLDHFAQDARVGLTCCGSAVRVMAGVYENTDARSAQSLSDVDFAFGGQNVPRPAAYRGPQARISDARHPTGPLPMAARGDSVDQRSYDAQADLPDAGASRFEKYPDGSTRSTFIVEGSAGVHDGFEQTTVTDGSGHAVASYERSGSTGSSGDTTTVTTEQHPGADGSTRTVAVAHKDGLLHITTVHTGSDGASDTTTFDEDPNKVIPTLPMPKDPPS